MIPVPDVIQLVFRIPCVLRLPAFQWHATEARLIFLVLGHLSQTLRLAVNPLKYNGKFRQYSRIVPICTPMFGII